MDLSQATTETLLAELAARGITHPEDRTPAARMLLVRLCADTGMTPPAPDDTLADWVDTALNSPLAPRGGPAWREGHLHLIDALEAALAGSEPVCRQSLLDAVAVVRAHGNSFCTCNPIRPLALDFASRRPLCTKCRRRRR